jgi:hypothetical protein
MIAFAAPLLLLVATVAAWFVAAGARAAARVQLRFASVLLAACAVAALTPAATAVVLLVLPIAIAVLALAALAGFERAVLPAVSGVLLAGVSLCGIVSAATGLAMFALGAAVIAAAALLLVCLRQFDAARIASVQGALAALCLLAAQSVFVLDRGGIAFLLFVSAGLLGTVLALARSETAVEKTSAADLRAAAISGRR